MPFDQMLNNVRGRMGANKKISVTRDDQRTHPIIKTEFMNHCAWSGTAINGLLPVRTFNVRMKSWNNGWHRRAPLSKGNKLVVFKTKKYWR